MWGAKRKPRDPNAPRRPRAPRPKPTPLLNRFFGPDPKEEPPPEVTVVDLKQKSPTIAFLVECLLRVHDDLKHGELVLDPKTGKVRRTGADPMGARVRVAALKGAADILQKERDLLLKERVVEFEMKQKGDGGGMPVPGTGDDDLDLEDEPGNPT